jgi:hypothetical protein
MHTRRAIPPGAHSQSITSWHAASASSTRSTLAEHRHTMHTRRTSPPVAKPSSDAHSDAAPAAQSQRQTKRPNRPRAKTHFGLPTRQDSQKLEIDSTTIISILYHLRVLPAPHKARIGPSHAPPMRHLASTSYSLAAHIMHARICKRHANQAGRGKRAQIPSGGAKSRPCPWIGRIRPAGFHSL